MHSLELTDPPSPAVLHGCHVFPHTREYDADLYTARLSADPAGLAAALTKLEEYQGRLTRRLFIPGGHGAESSLLRTHPKTEERDRRLLDSAEELQGKESPAENNRLTLPPHLRGPSRRPRRRFGGIWY